jgi:hypothetical protein
VYLFHLVLFHHVAMSDGLLQDAMVEIIILKDECARRNKELHNANCEIEELKRKHTEFVLKLAKAYDEMALDTWKTVRTGYIKFAPMERIHNDLDHVGCLIAGQSNYAMSPLHYESTEEEQSD